MRIFLDIAIKVCLILWLFAILFFFLFLYFTGGNNKAAEIHSNDFVGSFLFGVGSFGLACFLAVLSAIRTFILRIKIIKETPNPQISFIPHTRIYLITSLSCLLVILFYFNSHIPLFEAINKKEIVDKKVTVSIITPSSTEYPTPIPEEPIIIPTSPPKVAVENIPAPRTIPEDELIEAINLYRKARGLNSLNKNESLCQETRKRVQDMVTLNIGRNFGNMILNHDGMAADTQAGILNKLTGKTYFGENIAPALCNRVTDNVTVRVTTGVQLVEWCFDASPTHKENLLRPDWTDVCSSGQFPFYVQTFAK